MKTFLAAHIIFTVIILGLFTACSSEREATTRTESPLTIVCTTGMIADIVTQIAGDRAKIINLIGPGVDPHLYKPTRSDMARLLSADLVFYNGFLLEGKFSDAFVRLARTGTPVHPLAEKLDSKWILADEEDRSAADPHLWMDPLAWIDVVEHARHALTEYDPEGGDLYQRNSEILTGKLKELHAYSERVINTIPEEKRILITAHDAFQYFGRRYNIRVEGIQGLSTESEAGVRDIERLVNLLVNQKVPAVFIESTVSDRNIRALIEGAGARGHSVKIGGELFSDAFGQAGTYRGTYIGMIDHNVTSITRELGGEAPEQGFQGLL